MTSWRLRAAVAGMRGWTKPRLARATDPEAAARGFARDARLLFRRPPGLVVRSVSLGGVPAHRVSAGPVAPNRAVLWLHGGAYVAGSGATHAPMLGRLSRLAKVEVVAPDYRLAWQAPFPAAFDDALAAWDGLMRLGLLPGHVALGGDSSGGGLAFALLAQLLARGEKPAAVLAFSPWCDLTMGGESLLRHGLRDPMIPVGRMAEVAALYLGGASPRDPRASPIFADFPRPPAALIQVGAEEALRSDAEAMADRLRSGGGRATLDAWAGCPHVWQALDGWVPEARAALTRAAAFIQTSLDSTSR